MKRFTILFIVLALLVTAMTPALAAKGDAKKSQVSLQPAQLEPVMDQKLEQQGEGLPVTPRHLIKAAGVSVAPLAGLYSIGTAIPGGYVANYTTLTLAVADLQTQGVSGPVTFEFTDAAYSDSGVTIGGYPGQGAANPVIFRPKAGVDTKILFTGGDAVKRSFCIRLDSASYVTITGDVLPPSKGGARHLTLEADTNVSTASSNSRNGIVVQRGSNFINLWNMKIYGNRRGSNVTLTNSFDVIRMINPGPTADHDLSVENCWVLRGNGGITSQGVSGTNRDYNYTIRYNQFGGTTTFSEYLSASCISGGDVDNVLVDQNDIGTARGTGLRGINIVFGTANNTNIVITRNLVHNMVATATSGASARGIPMSSTAGVPAQTNYKVYNNMIYDLTAPNTTQTSPTANVIGVMDFGSGHSLIYNNSVHLYGSNHATNQQFTAALYTQATSTASIFEMKNNIIANGIDLPGRAGGSYGLADFNGILQSDYNVWWYYGADGNCSFFGNTLPVHQGTTGMDANSWAGDPYFVAPALHISTAVGVISPAWNTGTTLALVTDDIDKDLRASPPDIGADEFTANPFPLEAYAVGVISPSATGVPIKPPGITPRVKIKNNGALTVDIPVHLIITGSTGNTYDQVQVALGVAPQSFFDVFFDVPYNPTGQVEALTIVAKTELPGDQNPGNDQIGAGSHTVAKVVAPYFTNFEDGGEANWIALSDGGTNDWVLGTPAKPNIVGAYSGTKAWVTKLTGNYTNGDDASVYSPYFDLSGVEWPIIKLRNNWNESADQGYDGSVVDYTVDYGVTWNRLGAYHDPKGINWYDNQDGSLAMGAPAWSGYAGGVYLPSELYAKNLGGNTNIRFRVKFVSDGGVNDEGVAFDDFAINNAPSLSGDVWNDVNNSGTLDGGDVVFGGATVRLIRGTDTSYATTDPLGHYSVENLFEGNYNISCSVVFGLNTIPGGTGEYNIALVKNQSTVANFAYYNPATISGEVWYDENHNQVKDLTEGGLAGAVLTLNPGGAQFTTLANGLWSFTINNPGTYTVTQAAPNGYVQIFPKVGGYSHGVTYGDAVSGDQFGDAAAATLLEFRTASMNDWATAVDGKGKANQVKCKPYAVDFKFNIVAPTVQSPDTVTGVTVKIGIISDMVLTRGKAKLDTLGVYTAAKEFTWNGVVASGETLQVDGHGTKGKAVKPSYKWYVTLAGKAKKIAGKVTEFKLNEPRLPMPNLHNVGFQMGEQQLYPFTIGCSSGIGSILLDKYKTVMASLNKKGTLHTGAETCLVQFGGKPLKKQLKGYDPVKGNNRLFAEVLTLAMNLGASAREKFPTGLGGLIFDNHKVDPGPFDGKSIDTIFAQANAYLCNCDTLIKPGATSTDYYNVVKMINDAFAGAIDTITWSCGKLQLTGVKELKDVPYLRALPGYVQPATRFAYVPKPQVPANFDLAQNYPNPFNPTTTIQFSIPQEGLVTMKIYNMLGQEVASLLDNVQFDEGENEVEFDAASLPSGVYFYRLSVLSVDDEGTVLGQAFTQVKKMMLVK